MAKWICEKNGKYSFIPNRSVKDTTATQVMLSIKEYDDLIYNAQLAAAVTTEEKISLVQKKLEDEKRLNENLIRVATERANKNRNRNKTDNGYVITSWQPFHYKRTVKTGYKNTDVEHYMYYKITVQTPWDCSFSLKDIDRLVLEDLQNKKLDLTGDRKFKWFSSVDTNIDDAIEYEDGTPLLMVRQFRSDGRSGLWEVTFTVNFEPIIPEKHRLKYV